MAKQGKGPGGNGPGGSGPGGNGPGGNGPGGKGPGGSGPGGNGPGGKGPGGNGPGWIGAIKAAAGFLAGEPQKKHVPHLIAYFSAISALELAAYATGNGAVAAVASRIWIAGGALCLAGILRSFARAVKRDIASKNFLPLIGVAGIAVALLFICGKVGLADVSPEASLQAAAGLDAFKEPGWNYVGTAFLGYPCRQYLLVAIPALLFGRSIATLHLGFAVPFVLGLLCMYGGLRRWTDRKGIHASFAAASVAAIFAFRYVTEYYINFEQVILPISLTMALAGLFLNLLCKPSVIDIIGIAWLGCLCVNTYTPAMATMGLLVVFLGLYCAALLGWPGKLPFQVASRNETGKLVAAACSNIALFTAANFLGKRADRLTEIRKDISIIPFAGKLLFETFTDRNATFFGLMLIAVIPYMALSLAYRFKLPHLLATLWVMGVFVTSDLLVGYFTPDSPSLVMNRALVAVPVLVTGISLAAFGIMRKRGAHGGIKVGSALLAFFIAFGAYNYMQPRQSFLYFNYIQPMKFMLADLQETARAGGRSPTDRFSFVLDTGNSLMTNPINYFSFLYPNADVYMVADGEYPQEMDPALPVVIYSEREESLAAMGRYGDVETVHYVNGRYKTEGIWYKVYN